MTGSTVSFEVKNAKYELNGMPFANFFQWSYKLKSYSDKLAVLKLDNLLDGSHKTKVKVRYKFDTDNIIQVDTYKLFVDGKVVAFGDFDGHRTGITSWDNLATNLDAFDIWAAGHDCTVKGHDEVDNWFDTTGVCQANLQGGNDIIYCNAGNDFADGGLGMDQLICGEGNDIGKGGHDSDFLATGPGIDLLKGQSGNDVLLFGSGKNDGYGGAGQDMLVFKTDLPDAGEKWETQAKTVIHDYNGRKDVLVFLVDYNFDWPASAPPLDQTTLADISKDHLPDVKVKQVGDDLRIKVGDHVVILKNTTADEVYLDQLVFSGLPARDFADKFEYGTVSNRTLIGGTADKGGMHINHTFWDTDDGLVVKSDIEITTNGTFDTYNTDDGGYFFYL